MLISNNNNNNVYLLVVASCREPDKMTKCYFRREPHWHFHGHSAIFSVANHIGVCVAQYNALSACQQNSQIQLKE